jgi:hypothetical protein
LDPLHRSTSAARLCTHHPAWRSPALPPLARKKALAAVAVDPLAVALAVAAQIPTARFRPRTGTEGQGNVVINLLTQDPYGATKIQQVMYELNRAQVLGRPPVQIPPTTGISRVA